MKERGARTGQAGDEDDRVDPRLVKSGSATPLILHPQPVGEEPKDLRPGDDAADERQRCIPHERLDEHRQRLVEVARAEVA